MVISLILNIILLGVLTIFYINTSKKKSYERILCAAIKRKEPTYDNADFSDDHLCILGLCWFKNTDKSKSVKTEREITEADLNKLRMKFNGK